MKRYLFVILLLVFCSSVFAVVPDTLTRVVDSQWTLRLTKQNFRGSNFEVLIQNSTGVYDTYDPGEVRTYIGTVDEDPSAIAAGYLRTDGVLLSTIFFDGHGTYIYQGDTQIYSDGWGAMSYNYPTQPTVSADHAGTTMYEWGIGYDLDYSGYTQRYGSDPAYAMERIEFSHACMALLFMQDALLKPMVERVIIRGSQAHCPYYGASQYDLLGLLQSEWQNNQSDALTYCFKICFFSTQLGGGFAYLGGRWSVNGISSTTDLGYHIGRHELGHNWGAGDVDGGKPEGSTIMCGNSYARYCGPAVQDFLNHRDNNMSFLTSIGTYTAVDIAPYASLDVSEFTQTVTSSTTVNVLANDFDANGDSLSIDSYDSASGNGGTVTLNGQNLVYTAPGNYLGLDYFYYGIVDSNGMTATGLVEINVLPDAPLKLYMKFDESTGTVANDESFFAHNGTLENGFDFSTNGVTGQFGGALNFDGVNDYITLDDYKGIAGTQSRTIAAWIKTSDTNGVIVTWGGNGTGEKITFRTQNNNGTVGGIRLEVNGGYIVGTTNVCDNQWHHVAVVITDDGSPNVGEALLYVDGVYDGVSASVSYPINTVLTNAFMIGNDTVNRYLAGSIDELRVYDIAMSQTDIQDLMDGGVAEIISPLNTTTDVSFGELIWIPSAAAVSHNVYVGTDPNAVAAADPNSPEYQGSTTASDYWYCNLEPNTMYYWCVDTVTDSNVLPGSVWSFTADSTVCNSSSYLEQNSSGSKRLHSTSTDVDLATAGSTGSAVEWLLIPVGDDYYIRNVGDGGLLQAVNATSVDLAPAGTLGEAVKWQLETYTGDWMFIISKANGQKLHCSDATTPTLVDPVYTGSNVQWKSVGVPPAAPSGLSATPADGSVSLDWADNSELDFASYTVYRDTASGGPYTAIATDVTSSDYVDDTVTNGTTYYYVVTAVDTSSNESNDSNEVSATPQDATPPTPNPATFAVAPAADSDTAISMTATTGSDESGPVEYFFDETSGNPGGTDSGWQTSPSYTDTGLDPETQYTYTVTMRDSLSNTGTASSPASATTDPDPATVFYVEQNSSGSKRMHSLSTDVDLVTTGTTGDAVEWKLVPTAGGYYYICNIGDGSMLRAVNTTTVDLASSGSQGDALEWRFEPYVDSIGWMFILNKANGQKLHCNDGVTPTLADPVYLGSNVQWKIVDVVSTAPAAPTGLAATPGDGSVSLDWADNSDPDLISYTVYRDTTTGGPYTAIATDVTSSDYVDNTATNGTTYYYVVTAVDASSNESNDSSEVSATPQDTTPPTPNPATFAVAPAADSDTAISMTATTGSDPSGPVEYLFTETSGNPGGTSSGWQTSPSYTDTGLDPATQYTYTVTMRDSLNNTGTASSPASATTDAAQLTMYVQAIDLSVIAAGGVNRYGVATVTIYDQDAQPLSGATVYGTFTGSYNESGSAVTDAYGQAVIQTTAKAKNPSFTFTVTNVTSSGYTYDSASNVETSDTY